MPIDLKELKTQLEEYKGTIELALENKNKLTDEKIKFFGTELDGIKKSIESINENLKLASQKQLYNDQKDIDKFSLSKAIFAIANAKEGRGDAWKSAGYEKEAMDEYRKKTAIAGDGSNLGYLIPAQNSTDIIENVWDATPINDMGITRYDNLIGDLYIPKKTGKYTHYWVGEIAEPTASDMSIGQIHLSPKKVGGQAVFSRTLQQQTSNVADQIIRDELIKTLLDGVHDSMINGKGAQGEPRGLLNYASIHDRSDATAHRFTIDNAAAMYWYLRSQNEVTPSSKMGLLVHPLVLGGMLRERILQYSGQAVGTGQPVADIAMMMNPALLERYMNSLKIRDSGHMPDNLTLGDSTTCSASLLGDFSNFVIGSWRDIEIRSSDIIYMATDRILVVGFMCCDFAMKRETSFAVRKDCEITESSWTY